MQRLTLLRAVCITAFLTACSDQATVAGPITPGIITQPATLQVLIGTVEIADGEVWLRQERTLHRLTGSQANVMRSVAGIEVSMSGTYDGVDAYIVAEFAVRALGDQPAADGYLELLEEGYGLRLANNSLRMLVDPPGELLEHLGARVWVAGPADASPIAFGLIF